MDAPRSPLRRNLELKARLDRYEDALAACLRLCALDKGTVVQTDTYFTLGRHRLKLRESSGGEHLLIAYSREDGPDARLSQYRLEPVQDPTSLKATLTRQMGEKLVVRKARRWFLWEERVRIHLDRVESLGDFLEFEAVLDARPGYDESAARLDLARLSHDFGLTPRDLVASSYATLLAQAHAAPAST